MPGVAPEKLTPPVVREILSHVFTANSLFCIPPIQDYFALSSVLSDGDPKEERINIPGTVGGNNWTYITPCSVEDLLGNSALIAEISKLVEERRSRPLWKI